MDDCPIHDRVVHVQPLARYEKMLTFRAGGARPGQADGYIFQALEKWGNWGQIAPGVSNGQSEIKFTKLEFARPEPVAAQFDPDEGFTGIIFKPLTPCFKSEPEARCMQC